MSDDRRVYTDEEFALILRKTVELTSRAEPGASPSVGLTLNDMKAAAAQVGLDPAIVERAAGLVAAGATASPLERLIGGPLRHEYQSRFPVRLDEDMAARLLSAVRISASQSGSLDVGHSGPMGMTWHDGGEEEALGVTARPEGDGTAVSIVLDRRSTLVTAGAMSAMGIFLVGFAGVVLSDVTPLLGAAASIAGAGGVLAAARGYWASSTGKVRERISGVIDTIGQTLAEHTTRETNDGIQHHH